MIPAGRNQRKALYFTGSGLLTLCRTDCLPHVWRFEATIQVPCRPLSPRGPPGLGHTHSEIRKVAFRKLPLFMRRTMLEVDLFQGNEGYFCPDMNCAVSTLPGKHINFICPQIQQEIGIGSKTNSGERKWIWSHLGGLAHWTVAIWSVLEASLRYSTT